MTCSSFSVLLLLISPNHRAEQRSLIDKCSCKIANSHRLLISLKCQLPHVTSLFVLSTRFCALVYVFWSNWRIRATKAFSSVCTVAFKVTKAFLYRLSRPGMPSYCFAWTISSPTIRDSDLFALFRKLQTIPVTCAVSHEILTTFCSYGYVRTRGIYISWYGLIDWCVTSQCRTKACLFNKRYWTKAFN